jgi:hypothetical protein
MRCCSSGLSSLRRCCNSYSAADVLARKEPCPITASGSSCPREGVNSASPDLRGGCRRCPFLDRPVAVGVARHKSARRRNARDSLNDPLQDDREETSLASRNSWGQVLSLCSPIASSRTIAPIHPRKTSQARGAHSEEAESTAKAWRQPCASKTTDSGSCGEA